MQTSITKLRGFRFELSETVTLPALANDVLAVEFCDGRFIATAADTNMDIIVVDAETPGLLTLAFAKIPAHVAETLGDGATAYYEHLVFVTLVLDGSDSVILDASAHRFGESVDGSDEPARKAACAAAGARQGELLSELKARGY